MIQWIAERKLTYAKIGEGDRRSLLVRISAPYAVDSSSASFPVDSEAAACKIEIVGIDLQISEVTYGADSIQALQLASDVDPILRRISRQYDLFFESGEPYFE